MEVVVKFKGYNKILVSRSFGKVVFAFGRRGSEMKYLTGKLKCDIKRKYNKKKKTYFAGKKWPFIGGDRPRLGGMAVQPSVYTTRASRPSWRPNQNGFSLSHSAAYFQLYLIFPTSLWLPFADDWETWLGPWGLVCCVWWDWWVWWNW